MELHLRLAQQCIELDQEDMMYLDGGWSDWIITGIGAAAFAVGVFGAWGKQFAAKYTVWTIGKMVINSAVWIKNVVMGAI